MKTNKLFCMSALFVAVAMVATTAAAGPDKLSADDIKVILEEHKGSKGIDLAHHTATILPKHRQHKSWFLANLAKPTGDASRHYRKLVEFCSISA